jgi:hypothetical protein
MGGQGAVWLWILLEEMLHSLSWRIHMRVYVILFCIFQRCPWIPTQRAAEASRRAIQIRNLSPY